MDLDEFMATSNARAWRGRAWARAMLAGAITLVVLLVIVFVTAPTYGGTMMRPSDFAAAVGIIVYGVGVLGPVIGLAWMWRILRADPEPDDRSWRYRR